MASLATDLKWIRQKAEYAQAEVAGRQSLGSMVIWDGQNESSVDSEASRLREDFSGLVVHLTPDLSPGVGTESDRDDGLDQNDFSALKAEIVEALVGTTV